MKFDRAAIDACTECAVACSHCAASCLQEPDPKAMAACIACDIDCAEACRLAVGFFARGSNRCDAAAALCRATCEACAAECSRHDMDHCQACAEACRRCVAILGGGVAGKDTARAAAAIQRST